MIRISVWLTLISVKIKPETISIFPDIYLAKSDIIEKWSILVYRSWNRIHYSSEDTSASRVEWQIEGGWLVTQCHKVTTAVMKHHDQRQFGESRLHFTHSSI